MILVPGPGIDILKQAVSDVPTLPVPLDPSHIKVTAPVFLGIRSPAHVQSKVIPSPVSAYHGVQTINYERLDLNKAFGDIVPTYEGVSTGTLYSILPDLAQHLGIRLSTDDFLDADYSWLDYDATTNLKIEAKAGSFAYQGFFIVRFTKRRIMLSVKVKKPNQYAMLDVGRVYRQRPEPSVGYNPPWVNKDSVNMATYGTDFTPYRDILRPNKTYPQLFNNPTAVASMLRTLFNYTSWPSGWGHPIQLFETKNRPECRQDFEFVIIQRVNDPSTWQTRLHEGTAYFHFNETEIIIDEKD